MITLTGIALSLLVGYLLGYSKFFREQKQQAYKELLPAILKVTYPKNTQRTQEVEDQFNIALAKLWLYANRSVALRMDDAVSLIHHPEQGNVTSALQQAIVEMRKDIRWAGAFDLNSRLKPEEIRHIQTHIAP